MYKQKKNVWKVRGLAVLFTIGALGLAGCKGKPTVESLMKDVTVNTTKAKSYEASMIMDLKASGSMSGVSIDIGMNMDLDMEITQDPQKMHGKGTVSVEALGQSQNIITEIYTEMDGEKAISYAKTGDAGWVKQEVDAMTDLTALYGEEYSKELAEGMTLAEETTKVNQIECYTLTGNVAGSNIKAIMDTMLDNMEEMDMPGDMDMDNVEIPIEYYISKADKYPVKIVLDMKSVLDESMKAGADTGMTLTSESCTMEIVFSSFDTVEEIVIPDEAKNPVSASEKTEDTDSEIKDIFEQNETSPETEAATDSKETETVEPEAKESEAKEDSAVDGAGQGGSWDTYTITMNGKTITFPCEYQEMLDAGLELDTEYSNVNEEYMINAGEYTHGSMKMAGLEDVYISVYFINKTEGAKKITECQVGGIDISTYGTVPVTGLDVAFPGDITLGSKKEDAFAAYGEPNEKYESDDYATYTWEKEDSYYKSCKISVNEDGVITGFEMENLD